MPFGLTDPVFYSFFGVIVGGLLQILGSYATALRQQKGQNRRLQSQERIRLKVNSLVELFEQLDETNDVLNRKANTAGTNPSSLTLNEVNSEIQPLVDDYISTMRKNRVYLTDDQYEDMREAMGQFRMAMRFIEWKANNGNRNPPSHIQMDWAKFKGAYDTATETLRGEINSPLENLEEKDSDTEFLSKIR